MSINIIDLFAGPGGWDQGLRLRGRDDVVGIEWDADTCKAAELAGHERLHFDVSELDPREFGGWHEGLIASPPCQGFSAAGKGKGRADSQSILDAVPAVAAGVPISGLGTLEMQDHRSLLVLEPLRWAQALRPQWLAWEQVPAVLPLWEACGDQLEMLGYQVWTGLLHAEQYDVPQVRRRAVLMAHRSAGFNPPEPTRARYQPRDQSALDVGVPAARSMADALGWGMTERPYPTIACSRSTGGPDKEKVGGSGARSSLYAERDAGRWIHGGGCCCADPTRCGQPGVSGAPFAEPADRPLTAAKRVDGSIRLSLTEAAVLQTFPPDYPWHGNPSKRFQQIGNAVPPALAAHVLAALGVGTRTT